MAPYDDDPRKVALMANIPIVSSKKEKDVPVATKKQSKK